MCKPSSLFAVLRLLLDDMKTRYFLDTVTSFLNVCMDINLLVLEISEDEPSSSSVSFFTVICLSVFSLSEFFSFLPLGFYCFHHYNWRKKLWRLGVKSFPSKHQKEKLSRVFALLFLTLSTSFFGLSTEVLQIKWLDYSA